MNDAGAPEPPVVVTSRRDAVDPRLLEILVCPVTRSTLHYDAARQELVSQPAHMAFPIRGGVPVMITDEARPI
jgi:uncharacterized protein YbaR (Trm112 family)